MLVLIVRVESEAAVELSRVVDRLMSIWRELRETIRLVLGESTGEGEGEGG
jgi:hypothetical protein